jgi:pimeloyl-ACP methyl ester carboxylesterase
MSSWILLRGLTREARHWGDFPDLLHAALPEAQVTAIDLPGNGRLHQMKSPANIEAIAGYCRGQALVLGLRPPFHLLAMSLGAMVAVAWAQNHPEEIAACVLINTSLRPFNSFYERLRPGSYPTLLRLALPTGDERRHEAAVLGLTSNRATELADVVESWASWRRENPVTTANALRQILAAARHKAPRDKPIERILILAGRRDALVNRVCSQGLAVAWRTDYAEHPTAGHDLPLDDGPWVADQVRRWLCGTRPI